MPANPLRRLAFAARPDPASDALLVRTFLASRDEAAFAELVRRHGPMVLAACRRVLGHREDAEDAFQAAFLVLARKAGSVRGANLPGWLYAVAVRTARGVRVMRDRRRRRESASRGREPGEARPDRSPEQDELVAAVDEELAGLPEPYRAAVVLCELQGRPRRSAAAELGIPEGTLSSRLAAARRKLADRLARRGVTAPVVSALVPAAGPVSADLARAAVRAAVADGVASAVAAEAAAGVVKGLLVAELKAGAVAVGLAVGFVGGTLVATAPGGAVTAGDADVAPPPRPVPDVAGLVRQLGGPEFAAREAAGRKLRDIGPKAVPALAAAARDPNPEVARRAAGLVRAIRTDALAALAGSFDPAGTADYDHPVWKRFRSVAGPGRGRFHPTTTAKAHAAARTLFAEIIRDPDRLAALDGLAAEPDRAGEVYRTVVRDMDRQLRQRQAIMQRQMPWPGTTAAEVGYVLYLGTFPGTGVGADDRDAAREWAFGDRGVRGAYYLRQRLGLEEMTTPDPDLDTVSPAVMQLFLSWLAERDHPDTLRKGFEMTSAVGLDAPAALRAIDAARAVVANKRLPAKARAVGLPVLARLGSKADLPAFETLFADEAVVDTFRLSGAVPVDSPYDGTGAVQARDYAVGLALLLHGQDPAGYGFYMAQGRWNAAGGRADVTKYDPYHFGFVTGDDGRPATHAKARAWLAGQEKTDPPKVGGKVWDHYKAVVGDDKPARELFDRITADAKTRELLEAAAVGGHEAGKLYSDRGLELARLAREKTPASPEAVLGWLFAGTFPAADGKSPDVDDHLPHPNRNHPEPDETGLVRELTTGPQAAPARRVFAAWMAIQAKNGIIDRPLRVAIRCDIKEALPAARVALAAGHWQQTKRPPYGLDAPLLAIGKFGDETDLPRLAKFADDDRPTSGWHLAGGIVGRDPGKELEPVEGEDISVRVRDVAVAAMIARRGGKPEDFGFVWTKTDARKLIPWAGRVGDDPFGIDTPIGFARQADREAAHQKARAWLDQKK